MLIQLENMHVALLFLDFLKQFFRTTRTNKKNNINIKDACLNIVNMLAMPHIVLSLTLNEYIIFK